MILSKEQIKEMEERVEKATPGPWIGCDDFSICSGAKETHDFFNLTGEDLATEEDQDFILQSRTDIPALIQSHEELENLLIQSLPYLEVALDDPVYKNRGIKEIKKIIKTIKNLEH